MGSSRPILFVLSVIAIMSIYQGSVEGIKCWTCDSFRSPKCSDPFDNSSMEVSDCNYVLQTRTAPANLCQKTVEKIDGKWRIIRECAYADDPKTTGGGERNWCSTDGCNTANEMGKYSSLLTIIVSSIFLTSVVTFLI